MCLASDPGVLLDFERRWGDTVATAVRARGARAAWNVCVYDLADVRRTDDPIATTLDLARTHDEVWWCRNRRLSTGRPALAGVLRGLMPPSTPATARKATIDSLVATLERDA